MIPDGSGTLQEGMKNSRNGRCLSQYNFKYEFNMFKLHMTCQSKKEI